MSVQYHLIINMNQILPEIVAALGCSAVASISLLLHVLTTRSGLPYYFNQRAGAHPPSPEKPGHPRTSPR